VTTSPDPKALARQLLDDVRAGRADPSSGEAQRLMLAALFRGWITQREADEAADAYWDARSKQRLEEVRSGQRDPKDPETAMLLDWGEAHGSFTKKERREAERNRART
jgi:hypothetical protein